MFVILKPDADLGIWFKRIHNLGFDFKAYTRNKNEDWVRMHYHLLPEDILQRNVDFFTRGTCVGIEIDCPYDLEFPYIRKKLRNFRVINPKFMHRNQIHVPDSLIHSDIEKELFLDETTNRTK